MTLKTMITATSMMTTATIYDVDADRNNDYDALQDEKDKVTQKHICEKILE